MREAFSGRSTEAITREVPMRAVSDAGGVLRSTTAETRAHFDSKSPGTGTLFYTARLQYVVNELFQDALDTGFAISRSYAPCRRRGATGRRRRPRHSRPAISCA